MAFDAKRLRVQLPCGEATVVQQAKQTIQFTPTACGFVSPTICHWPSHQTCWCSFQSPPVTVTCAFGTCGVSLQNCTGTIQCGGSGDPTGPVEIDAEHLPVLREQLEAQLAEIAAAEKAVEEHQG